MVKALILDCPKCGSPLYEDGDSVYCKNCKNTGYYFITETKRGNDNGCKIINH